MTHPRMMDLWREVNINMCVSNDMLSLRKEITHGDIDSIIPVLVNTGLCVDSAITVCGSLFDAPSSYQQTEKATARCYLDHHVTPAIC
jgi:hypothetical protein